MDTPVQMPAISAGAAPEARSGGHKHRLLGAILRFFTIAVLLVAVVIAAAAVLLLLVARPANAAETTPVMTRQCPQCRPALVLTPPPSAVCGTSSRSGMSCTR
jgi:hypothetical protein